MNSGADNKPHVVVVGGGWAGLAAAVELSHCGIRVTLLESAKQLGGRARCISFNKHRVDNGQHIMLGAYHHMLSLIDALNVAEENVFIRRPFSLRVKSPHKKDVIIQARELPMPFHLLWGMVRASGLSVRERYKVLRLSTGLFFGKNKPDEDISVMAYLLKNKQPPRLIKTIWEPLCIAALNTPVHEASAKIFLRVLTDTFTRSKEYSDVLIPRTDLGTALPDPAMDFIERHGGTVRLSQRVTGLMMSGNRITGVVTKTETIAADHVVLATPHVVTRRLLKPHAQFSAITNQLSQLKNYPICTIYLQYPVETRLDNTMTGLTGSVGQWVFDRRFCGQPGLLAVVISSEGPHMKMDADELATLTAKELKQFYPHLPEPKDNLVIREKRAAFNCHVNIDTLRPQMETPVTGCWLAGDYVANGLPATLEGAVTNGLTCAGKIARQLKQASE